MNETEYFGPLHEILEELRIIRKLLERHWASPVPSPPSPTAMRIQFQNEKGSNMSPDKGTVTDHLTISASNIETDANGNDVTLTEDPSKLAWSIDNTAIASLKQNPDGTVTITGQSVGQATVSCTDNSRQPPLVGTGTVTVTPAPPGAPVKLSIVFSA
jgi:hypothetical protein